MPFLCLVQTRNTGVEKQNISPQNQESQLIHISVMLCR